MAEKAEKAERPENVEKAKKTMSPLDQEQMQGLVSFPKPPIMRHLLVFRCSLTLPPHDNGMPSICAATSNC
jgi:hypothetical protein